VPRHSGVYDDYLELIIEHDKLHQLDNVIDDLEHDHDDDNSVRKFLRIYLAGRLLVQKSRK